MALDGGTHMNDDTIITLQLPLKHINTAAAGLSQLPLGRALEAFIAIKEQVDRQVAEIQAGPPSDGPAARKSSDDVQ